MPTQVTPDLTGVNTAEPRAGASRTGHGTPHPPSRLKDSTLGPCLPVPRPRAAAQTAAQGGAAAGQVGATQSWGAAAAAAGRPSAQRPSHRPRTLLTAPGLSSPGAAGSFRKAVTALQKAQDPVGTEQVSKVGDTKEISVCEAQGSNLKDFKNGRF